MHVASAAVWPHVRWLDDDTVLVLDRIAAANELLPEEEQLHANEMNPPRRREFAAGRALARRALSILLAQPISCAIPVGAAGEPVWPEGLRGSISHTNTHAAVVVTRDTRHTSVGIDLDDRRLIGVSAAADLMTGDEIEAVLSLGWASEIEIARNIVFLAKEALFKYQYPLAGNRDLDFAEVRVRVSPSGASLRASPRSPDPTLEAAVSRARIQYQEIQQVRLCWVLPDP